MERKRAEKERGEGEAREPAQLLSFPPPSLSSRPRSGSQGKKPGALPGLCPLVPTQRKLRATSLARWWLWCPGFKSSSFLVGLAISRRGGGGGGARGPFGGAPPPLPPRPGFGGGAPGWRVDLNLHPWRGNSGPGGGWGGGGGGGEALHKDHIREI